MVQYGGIPDRKVDGTINPSLVNKYFNILTVYWLSFFIEKRTKCVITLLITRILFHDYHSK